MDPISMALIAAVVSGVTAGVSSGATSVVSQGMVDAYNGLKDALIAKFGSDSDLAGAVDSLERKPDSESRQGVVREAIEESNAYKDDDLKALAEALLSAVQQTPEGAATVENYITKIKGSNVAVVGKNYGPINIGDKPDAD